MNRRTRRLAVVATGLTVVLALTAESCDSQQDAPEPTPENIINGTNTQVIQMPDGFRNVAFTCYGTSGVYVTSRGAYQHGGDGAVPLASSLFVVPNDPHCPAGPR